MPAATGCASPPNPDWPAEVTGPYSRGMRRVACFLALVVAAGASAQSSGIRTYANPIDIEYKYNWEGLNEGVSYRSGADPAVVNHHGEYFLFVTVSGGYWRSRDLVHW